MKKAVMILAHGSRHPEADSTIQRVAAEVRNISDFEIVVHAFLQHVEPGPEEVLEECVKHGAGMIVIVPFFLQSGAHVNRDVTVLAREARNRFPNNVEIRVAELVGSHPLMARIVAELAEKSQTGFPEPK